MAKNKVGAQHGGGRAFPQNVSRPVTCQVQGYEGVQATFVVSRTQKELDSSRANGGNINKLAATVLGEFTVWPFDSRKPVAGDADSFAEIPTDLLTWLVGKGYQEALKSIISPN